jgi:hypothetical protein
MGNSLIVWTRAQQADTPRRQRTLLLNKLMGTQQAFCLFIPTATR